MALGAALEPKQKPDGTWVFNTALGTLELYSAADFRLLWPPMTNLVCGTAASP